MNKITIAVGSKRGPKLNAVTEALQAFSAALAQDAQFEFVGVEGGLDVVHEGLSADEMMRHSRLRQNGHRRVFLESCAYVSDGVRGHYGCSGSIELPEALAHEVLENGVELAVAIDRFAGA